MLRLIYLFTLIILLSACGGSEQPLSDKNNEAKADDRINDDNNQAEAEKTINYNVSKDKVLAFVPKGYELVNWSKGDLNLDDREDALLVVQKTKSNESKKSTESTGSTEDNTSSIDDNSEEKRPLIILTMDSNGDLQAEAENDAVILCPGCGGIMGDPFSSESGSFAIKNGYFSVEHYGGSNWRWNRIITFKYNKNSKEWFLHKDGIVSWHTSDPDKITEKVLGKKDFGTISFENYNVDDMDL